MSDGDCMFFQMYLLFQVCRAADRERSRGQCEAGGGRGSRPCTWPPGEAWSSTWSCCSAPEQMCWPQIRRGETPLNAACSGAERPSEAGRYLRVVQKLLAAGADPRTAGRKQHTPLHNACANCTPRIVDVLLLHGARPDVANCAGYTPMDCLLQAVEDYPGHQPEAIARSLLNHGAQPVSTKMLKQCVLSPATLEVMLNSYTLIPRCAWMDSLSTEIYEEHKSFLDLVRRRTGQPRSLQHLCRWALRLRLGARCFPAVSELHIPSSLKDYLLLSNDGTLQ
ncbi:hypothetical protein CesoFtcFv8_018496 [Champsocephalus esox]|uniref:SOCS box domain-containing protein n=1 Tax=Champsocephalus esox TaxID=159716 RepID=A0AAN8BHI2_9TELE|nr:hypothetical protein CesoFtcFv8_018496 [Champsocephalus esox]